MGLNQAVTIDIARRGTVHVPAKQGDHGYKIVFTLLDGGVNYVEATDTASFRVQKPDGNAVFGSCTVAQDLTVVLPIDDDGQILAVAGYASADISVYDASAAKKSIQNFVLDIQAAPGGPAIPSSSEFLELEQLISDGNDLLDHLQSVTIVEATTARDQAVAARNAAAASEASAANYAAQTASALEAARNYTASQLGLTVVDGKLCAVYNPIS